MRQNRIAATNSVAQELFETEAAIDQAIAAAARLQTIMPQARLRAKLSIAVGQEALEHVQSSIGGLISARRSVGKAHAALDTVKTSIGLKTLAMGGGMEKPLQGVLAIVDDKVA